MKETYFNEKLEKVSFKRRKDYCIPGYIHLMYISFIIHIYMFWGPGWLNELDRWIYATHTSLSPIRRGFAPGLVNY